MKQTEVQVGPGSGLVLVHRARGVHQAYAAPGHRGMGHNALEKAGSLTTRVRASALKRSRPTLCFGVGGTHPAARTKGGQLFGKQPKT